MLNKFLKLVVLAGIGFASTSAFALTTLKQVQVTNGSQVDLLFDGKIKPAQIRTEFFNDTIQVSLTDAAVYPAKISSVNGDALTKIFAYQYAPKLVRCRITVKGKAEDYKDLFTAKAQGKILTLRVGQSSDQITLQSSAPEAQAGQAKKRVVEADAFKISEAEEKALLERVLKSQPVAPTTAVMEKQEAAPQSSKRSKRDREESPKALAGGKPLPSLWSALAKLAMVIALFLAAAFAVRKFRGVDFGSAPSGHFEKSGLMGLKGLGGALSRFTHGIGIKGAKGKMIEVVSTHHLGPKKSIAVVKVAGRTLVLGVSAESINLITQIDGNGEADFSDLGGLDIAFDRSSAPEPASPGGLGATAAGPAFFSELLRGEATQPQAAYARGPGEVSARPVATPPSSTNVRAQIRSRLEGLKPL
jgi:flagellar biogenesis protein FliO